VYLTHSLYVKLVTDELLAAVLAHGMAHIVSKDHFKPRCSTAGEVLDRELSADAEAIHYLRAAGFPADAMIGAIEIIQEIQTSDWADIRTRSIRPIPRQGGPYRQIRRSTSLKRHPTLVLQRHLAC